MLDNQLWIPDIAKFVYIQPVYEANLARIGRGKQLRMIKRYAFDRAASAGRPDFKFQVMLADYSLLHDLETPVK